MMGMVSGPPFILCGEVSPVNKKSSVFEIQRFQLPYLCLLVFAVAMLILKHYAVAFAEAACALILYVLHLRKASKRQREVVHYLEKLEGGVDQATRSGIVDCPLPVVVFRPDTDEVIWSNKRFLKISGDRDRVFDLKLSAAVPGFHSRWLMEGKNVCPEEVELDDRRYQVYGHLGRMGSAGSLMATTYWVDVTEFSNTREMYTATRPVVAVLLLDNYEDAIKSLDESARSLMLSEVNRRFAEWTRDANGMFCRLSRDRYLFVFEEQYLDAFKAEKFSVLDEVRAIEMPNHIPVTLSIGIGVDGESFEELYQFANLSVEMALSRGGDQVVLKNRFTFEFFGGRAKETEKRTKVKSRVMASALSELVADASCIFVMGHAAPDMDAVGAAVGVCAIARKKGIPAYLIREGGATPADDLYDRVKRMGEYADCFLDTQEALLRADSRSLLVVVDTNRPEQVQSRELLASCNKVAVIDHHRRAATYIEGAAFNFHEPYASSASELVTELISYIMDPADLLRGEAEALMAGLMLDTKNFTMRTGARTFEAAAFLRQAGGDTGEVKKMFQNDLSDTIAKYDIIQNARMYRHGIAIAPVSHTVGRVTAAQAADELLNIAGISASFVLYPDEGRVILSARSLNETNVQVIAEALGGGGNGNAAGAQLPGRTVDEVNRMLMAAIDDYFDGDEEAPDTV